MNDIMRLGIADSRDEIIFGEPFNRKKYPGGCRYFDELTLNQIEELVEMDLLNMKERQNLCPPIGKIIEFLRGRQSTGWYVHGYCVSPERGDFRISFEGVGKKSKADPEDLKAFKRLFRNADNFEADDDGLYCWYD